MGIINELVGVLGATPFKRRWVAPCPFCRAPVMRGQIHFSFWHGLKPGYKCFVCGEGGGLVKLAQHLKITPKTEYQREQKIPLPPAPPWWQNLENYMKIFAINDEGIQKWYEYKGISPESIAHFSLGYGKMPYRDEKGQSYFGRYNRLILPTIVNGEVVALEGRACHPEDDGPKWICATGSSKAYLFGGDCLFEGATVVVAENKADCILAMQEGGENLVAVTGGGSFWRTEWTRQIAQSKPKNVIVWRDNDLVGQPNTETEALLLRDWYKKVEKQIKDTSAPMPNPPEAMGAKIATEILRAGCTTQMYVWPAGTPAKADLGWHILIQRGTK